MKIDILTLFPEMFIGPFDQSIIKRAKEKGLVDIRIDNLRNWAIDDHGTVDDRPYGGGTGMVLRPEPIVAALEAIKHPRGGRRKDSSDGDRPKRSVDHGSSEVSDMTKVILLSASGKLFNQQIASSLSHLSHLILICGHYEGVDQRIADHFVDEELSIGDYVLTGGEIPAMVIVDSVVRLIPGVLEKEAIEEDSFSLKIPTAVKTPGRWRGTDLDSFQVEGSSSLLEHPHYTRPEVFHGLKVPKVLLSGNHREIEKWRIEQAMKRTEKNRPDLLTKLLRVKPKATSGVKQLRYV